MFAGNSIANNGLWFIDCTAKVSWVQDYLHVLSYKCICENPIHFFIISCFSIVEWDQKDASTEKDAIISGVHKSRQKTCEPHPKRCRKTRRNKRHATCKGKRGCMKSPGVPGILQATGGSKVKASSSNNCQVNTYYQ